jgi:hypothetical protein
MKKKLWFLFIIAAIICVIGYNYIYQDHRNISSESADFIVNSISLSEEFKINTQNAETKYLNKTLIVKGEISEINASDLTLNDLIFLNLNSTIETNSLKLNKTISIKGRCLGYDDLLEQVKLDQCTLIN